MGEAAVQYHNVDIHTSENDNDNYSEHDTSTNEFNESNEYYECNIDKSQNDFNEINELRKWAVACNIRSAHLDKLLLILRKRLLPQLPKSSVTFLNTTEAMYNIQIIKGAKDSIGEYVYLGIENGLNRCVNPKVHTNDRILLQINVDGASPYGSSTKQLRPILCKILHNSDIYSPFPVVLYYRDTKPGNVDEYMSDFMEEINLVQKNGHEKIYTATALNL